MEDSTEFAGFAAGYRKSVSGEVVFATGMVGYEQSLTDPSYAGQVLVFTFPLIGNWGVPSQEFWESEKIQVEGVVISDLTTKPSHYLSQSTLDEWLVNQKIPSIVGVDTRALTQRLREKGTMLGKIIIDDEDVELVDPNDRNLVAEVSVSEPKVHFPAFSHSGVESDSTIRELVSRKLEIESGDLVLNKRSFANAQDDKSEGFQNDIKGLKVALLNCGTKRNIVRSLVARGVTVYELPWNYDPWENNLKIDGLVISNGPGDPKTAKESISIIRKALGKKIPTFGICLGNQLLSLAAGGETYKLKFGHRAQNQPTIQVDTKRCFITTQNHGFAVSEKKLPDGFSRWFYNANDNTNEGIIHQKLPFFSVQFHPEATPGPYDTEWLFDYFIKRVMSY